MADNRIKIILELEKGGATASLKNFEGDLIKSGVAVGDLRKELGNFVISSKKMSNSVKLTDKELKSLEKTVGGFKSATGGATAAAMELGRVVSDAPYGIRGMANNVSQLASQITYMANATDKTTGKTVGFVGAIKGVGKALMGTTGVLFLIQGAIAALDYFYGANKKAEKSVSSFRESVAKAGVDLKSLVRVINDDILTKEELEKVITKVNKKYDDLNLKVGENGKLTKDSELQIRNKIKALDDLALANAMMAVIEEKQGSLIKAQLKLQEDVSDNLKKLDAKDLKDFKENREELIRVQEGYYKGQIDANKLATAARISSSVSAFEEEKSKLEESIRDLLKMSTDGGFFDDFFNGKKNKKEKKKVDKKDAASVLLDLYGIDISDKARQEYLKKLEDSFDFSTIDLKGQFEEQLRGLDRAKQIGAIAEEQYNEYLSKMKEKFSEDHIITGVAPKLEMELSDETQASIDAYNKEVIRLMSEKFKAEDFASYADTAKQALSNISNFIDAQFDRQLVKENNRTNAMNEELNNRLLNENLSAKERANIQNEIAQNDEALRKKQNDIKKKAFNTNKAFQLAMAVADTSSAVLKAYLSQLIPGDPTSIVRAKIAAATAGAMGALQIATIASSKFQPDAASTPIRTASGGGGGGLGNRTFDFNLVGNNQNNQLAEAIGSQFDKPLKAYVVSKDITNQQQLDANIKSSARFGG